MIQRLLLLALIILGLTACGDKSSTSDSQAGFLPGNGRPTLLFFFTDN